ncbi:peptidylprolyl isomerase [Bdellovibrionota bacterium FG-2]
MTKFSKQIWILGVGFVFACPGAWAVDLATVNGKVITDKDLKSALSGVSEGQRENLLKDASSRRQILTSMIDQELLVQEAEKDKMDQDAEYKEALNSFRKQYLTGKVLNKKLAAKISDSTVKKYYENHKSRFSTDEVHAQHILVSDEAVARDLLKKAKEPNADFQVLAEKNSKDPSAKNNRGDLGFFGRDRMVPEFTEAAFSGKAGDIVGPVKTSFGYHIIKVIELKPGKALPFSDVEARVRMELRNELIQEMVGKLKQQAKVNVDDKAVDKL